MLEPAKYKCFECKYESDDNEEFVPHPEDSNLIVCTNCSDDLLNPDMEMAEGEARFEARRDDALTQCLKDITMCQAMGRKE